MIHESRRLYGKVKKIPIGTLQQAFAHIPYVKLALLFGSRAAANRSQSHAQSDYDFAVLMDKSQDCDWGLVAKVRTDLGVLLSLPDEDFDVVDLRIAPLPLLESINSQYRLLKGDIDEFRDLFTQQHKDS